MSPSKQADELESETENILTDHGTPKGIGGLVDAWKQPRVPFDEYVRNVSTAYFSSNLRLEPAARWCETSAAELAAILHLATMQDEDLALMSKRIPAKTTWFILASVEGEALRRALDALETMPPGVSPHVTVARAIRSVKGPDAVEKVGRLSSDIIGYMAKKAKQYGVLRPKDRSALVSMSRQKKYGKPLSLKQAVYLHGMLTQLVDSGAVKADSPDDDQEKCDAVMQALKK